MAAVSNAAEQFFADEAVEGPVADLHGRIGMLQLQPLRDLPGRVIQPQTAVHFGPQPRVVQFPPAPPARDFHRPRVGGYRLIGARIAGQFPPDCRGGSSHRPGRRFDPLALLHVNHDDGALC